MKQQETRIDKTHQVLFSVEHIDEETNLDTHEEVLFDTEKTNDETTLSLVKKECNDIDFTNSVDIYVNTNIENMNTLDKMNDAIGDGRRILLTSQLELEFQFFFPFFFVE